VSNYSLRSDLTSMRVKAKNLSRATELSAMRHRLYKLRQQLHNLLSKVLKVGNRKQLSDQLCISANLTLKDAWALGAHYRRMWLILVGYLAVEL
jgi:hypothetical protein